MTDILVVDDDEQVRELIRDILEPHGYHCVLACDGDEACEFLSRNNFSAVITDIDMPHMDGIELLKFIRKKSALIPVIMITAYQNKENIINSLNLGATYYIEKPMHPKELVDVVTDLLQIHMHRSQPASKVKDDNPFMEFQLTYRERQIARYMLKGYKNAEIGAALKLKENTVKNYITNIYMKCGVENRNQFLVKFSA